MGDVADAARASAAIARRTIAPGGAVRARKGVRPLEIRVEAEGLHHNDARNHALRRRLVVLAAALLASVAFGLWLGRSHFLRSSASDTVTIAPAPAPAPAPSSASTLAHAPVPRAKTREDQLPEAAASDAEDADEGADKGADEGAGVGSARGRREVATPKAKTLRQVAGPVGGSQDDERSLAPEERCTRIVRRNLSRPREAIQELGALRRDHPKAPCLFWHLGVQYEKLGDFLAAKAAFRRYLMVEPTSDRREAVERRIQALDQKLERR